MFCLHGVITLRNCELELSGRKEKTFRVEATNEEESSLPRTPWIHT